MKKANKRNTPQAQRLTQQQADALVNRCIAFTDRHGTILFRESTAMLLGLTKEYLLKDLKITFSITASAITNGISRVEVYWRKKKVFAANGRFIASAYNCTVTRYTPGVWKKKITV